MIKRTIFIFLCALFCSFSVEAKINTLRAPAQYLSVDKEQVKDTCPGADIRRAFSCTKKQDNGFSCFDVYEVEGDPPPSQRYTLLDENISTQLNTADPACNFSGELNCGNFLSSLKYNLDFSWFITNFPSSSFEQCAQTYTCTRIACWRSLPPDPSGEIQSQKLMCVYKKEQTFFLGTQVTCQNTKSVRTK